MENENFDLHFDSLLPALLCYWAELDVTDFTSSLSQPEISPPLLKGWMVTCEMRILQVLCAMVFVFGKLYEAFYTEQL